MHDVLLWILLNQLTLTDLWDQLNWTCSGLLQRLLKRQALVFAWKSPIHCSFCQRPSSNSHGRAYMHFQRTPLGPFWIDHSRIVTVDQSGTLVNNPGANFQCGPLHSAILEYVDDYIQAPNGIPSSSGLSLDHFLYSEFCPYLQINWILSCWLVSALFDAWCTNMIDEDN